MRSICQSKLELPLHAGENGYTPTRWWKRLRIDRAWLRGYSLYCRNKDDEDGDWDGTPHQSGVNPVCTCCLNSRVQGINLTKPMLGPSPVTQSFMCLDLLCIGGVRCVKHESSPSVSCTKNTEGAKYKMFLCPKSSYYYYTGTSIFQLYLHRFPQFFTLLNHLEPLWLNVMYCQLQAQ